MGKGRGQETKPGEGLASTESRETGFPVGRARGDESRNLQPQQKGSSRVLALVTLSDLRGCEYAVTSMLKKKGRIVPQSAFAKHTPAWV